MTRESARGVPLLSVEGLVVEVSPAPGARGGEPHTVVAGASFDIWPGETLGLIGASGAGKTMTALALLRLLPAGARVTAGRVLWRGRDVLTMPDDDLRAVRGGEIGMIFQDPAAALHPLLRIDEQVAEAIRTHAPTTTAREALDAARELLVRLDVPIERIRHAPYPHQWSGGMCQRAMIAMAISNGPALLIADEPTTALDAMKQVEVLALLDRLHRDYAIAMLLLSHDLSVIAATADRVAVMHAGRLVEIGPVQHVLERSTHPHTQRLVARTQREVQRAPHIAVSPRGPVLEAHGLHVHYRAHGSGTLVHAVHDVSLAVAEGETLGLVGESGAGKSSLARALLRLTPVSSGRVLLNGTELTSLGGAALTRARASVQIVFQNPYASLNPRRRVGASVAEPLRIHARYGKDGEARVIAALASVGLAAEFADRFPRQLSGGERQRVAIARALVLSPAVLVLDEPVSSLDVPTREAILSLLLRLQAERGLAYLFISHDLDVVQRFSHRVAVMYQGRIVETGTAQDVRERPTHPYTKALLSARPTRGARRARADAADDPSSATLP